MENKEQITENKLWKNWPCVLPQNLEKVLAHVNYVDIANYIDVSQFGTQCVPNCLGLIIIA